MIDRSRGERLHWLCKCEPADLSIDTLERTGSTQWDGVRNPTARNHLISMRKGDLAFFYISSVKQPAIVAVMQVDSDRAAADETQFDQASCYFDSSATRAQPKWFSVRFRFLQRFAKPVVRDVIKGDSALADMQMLRQGRLSVSVVTPEQWDRICLLGGGFSEPERDDDADNASA
jgi:predicted RNA-binding protein with PUA-like domain